MPPGRDTQGRQARRHPLASLGHGTPIIEDTVAYIDCVIVAVHDAGDHEIVIGQVLGLDVVSQTNPLLFFRGGYGSFIPRSLAAGDADLYEQLRLVDLARPHMEWLAGTCDTEVTAISLVRDELVLTAAAGRAKTAQAPTRVGQRVPFMPPLGGVFAAWGDDDLRGKWLGRLDADATAEQLEAQREAPDRIRARGYSIALGHTRGERLESLSTRVNLKEPGVSAETLKTVIREVSAGYNAEDVSDTEEHELRSLSAPVFGPDGACGAHPHPVGSAGDHPQGTHRRTRPAADRYRGGSDDSCRRSSPPHPVRGGSPVSQSTTDADVDRRRRRQRRLRAAHAAAERGRRVLLLEKAPPGEAGGNSYYTAGATRIAHDGLDDLLRLRRARRAPRDHRRCRRTPPRSTPPTWPR